MAKLTFLELPEFYQNQSQMILFPKFELKKQKHSQGVPKIHKT